MDLVLQAKQLIAECESRVRGMITDALAAREYDGVARLADLASALSTLAISGGAPQASTSPQTESDVTLMLSAADHQTNVGERRKAPSNASPAAKDYPRFERQDDRLIKIGWSKKDRRSYEHRTTLEVVHAVVAKLPKKLRKGGYLKMEDVLPVELADGSEVPSYQTYLVLAWLRDKGAVVRQGHDGYRLASRKLDSRLVEELWKTTLERQ